MAAQWFYRRAGAESATEHGPFTSGKIRRMVSRGEIEPTDLLWKQGMDEWRPAGESATLFGRADARAARRQRDRASASSQRTAGKAPAAAAPPAWVGRRPLLVSIGIGTGAGVVISAVIVALILVFGGTASEEEDTDAVVARPAKPAEVKPAAAQPAAAVAVAAQPAPAQPAPAQPAAAEPAGVEQVALAIAPPPADQPQADPPAESQAGASPDELPADLKADAPPKPPVRIRVRLPGEDF